jgi:hypothetical protein
VSNTHRGTGQAMLSALGRRLATFLGACASSRVGWAFATIHALWFYVGVRSMGPPSRAAAAFLDGVQGADWTLFAGRPFHFVYQSWILKSVIVADMPSMLAQAVCGLILWPVSSARHVGIYEGSYISAGVLFVIASMQWLIVGHAFEQRFRRVSH